jgi:isopenicillin N synthase-like dioxygenase
VASPPARFTRANPGRAAFLAELRALLHDQGFFYLTGHGVDPALITETLAVAKRFFTLPRALLSPEELAATGPASTY